MNGMAGCPVCGFSFLFHSMPNDIGYLATKKAKVKINK